MRLILPPLLVLLAGAGCSERNPAYCDSDSPVCPEGLECNLSSFRCEDPNAPDASIGCSESDQCPETTPICAGDQCAACESGAAGDEACVARDVATPRCAADGRCVGCLNSDDCSAGAPFCDTTAGICRPCADHEECVFEVCDLGAGSCVDSANIVYVAPNGTDEGACGTISSPCATVSGSNGALDKIGGARRTIRLRSGTFTESVDIDIQDTLSLVGHPMSRIIPPADLPGIIVRNATTVLIDRITIEGASGTLGDGLRCEGTSVVTLRRSLLQDNAAQGFEAVGCDVTLERSSILRNRGGGVRISDSSFVVRNNLVVGNGSAGAAGSTIGGVSIDNPNPASPQIFEFNTVADSLARTDAPAAGVYCTTTSTGLARNNIVFTRSGGTSMVFGPCVWSFSDVEGGVPGTGNINLDPLFVNLAGGDVHIDSGSPCRNAADPAATVNEDIDGDPRPEGDRHDMGADEVR